MLEDNFGMIMDIGFTAAMEDDLEQIEDGKTDWKDLIRLFWKDFIPYVETAEKEALVPKIDTDIECPRCKAHKLQKIWSRQKYFYGCANYPECKYTAPIEALEFNKEDYDPTFDWDQKCPKCGSPMQLRFGKFGPFLGCTTYPECKGIVNIPKKGELSQDEMPQCPAIGCDGKLTQRRSRFGKPFFSCSNYPDCDVIVNHLEDLYDKYPSHPKTPYIKKTKFKEKEKTMAKKAAKKKTKRKSTMLSKSVPLSADLAAIVGSKSASRPEVMKKLWHYIKAKKLQDPKARRMICPDEKLAKVFGSKRAVDMLKLGGLLNKHIDV